MDVLAKELDHQIHPLPTILAGDFNSYSKERSGLNKNDMTYFEEMLSATGRVFRSFTTGLPTYGAGELGRDYDHIVASQEISKIHTKAYGACGKSQNPKPGVVSYLSYRKNFSDHCYVTAKIQISYEI